MNHKLLLGVLCVLLIMGCEGGDVESINTNPFRGGTDGLDVRFESGSPPSETFDQGTAAFDVLVRLENKGETLVLKDDVQVKISGINPADFGTTDGALVKNAPDDLIEVELDSLGRVNEGVPSFVEFVDLSYVDEVAGSSLSFPLRADVCYLYSTQAVGKLCIRENIMNPLAGGLCEVNGDKTLFVSAAPVQVANLVEQARARDKIGFTFEITHPGAGEFFERATACDQTDRRKQQRTFVKVQTKIPGLSCTGLQSTGDGVVEGFVTMFDAARTVSCTQQLPALRDFELPVGIELTYDYLQNVQTAITVKDGGE